VNHFVPEKVGPPGEAFGAVLALVLVPGVAVRLDHVVVKAGKKCFGFCETDATNIQKKGFE
jgi:hypothetical protein